MPRNRASRRYQAELDAELALVRNAILLAGSSDVRRVVVANIRHGRVIEIPAREFATSLGRWLSSIPTADPRRVDLVIDLTEPVPGAVG